MAGRILGLTEYMWTVYYQGTIQQIPDSRYRILQSLMFIDIWNEREHSCAITDKSLPGEPRTYYFHHILEKSKHEEYALCKWNIVIVDWLLHDRYERKNDVVPELVTIKQDLLTKLDNNEYRYDGDCLWRTGTQRHNVDACLGSKVQGGGQV